MNLTCAEIASLCGAELVGDGETRVQGISTDTRTLRPGDLFVAIRGERHDGHQFCDSAIARGALAVLVSGPVRLSARASLLRVTDTVRALGDLAHATRRGFGGPVVAITGSNGKTTTKEICAGILGADGVRVRRSPGNLNNAIGLPLSVLTLEAGDEALVVELGMNRPGEIDALGRIVEPTVGAITQIAPAHLEGLGSIEAVARAKGELLDRLRPDGTAVLNAGDERVVEQARRFQGRKLWFASEGGRDFSAEALVPDGNGTAFKMCTPIGAVAVRLGLPGRHLVDLALCAAACAVATGLLSRQPLDAIREGIERFDGVPGRLRLLRSAAGYRILDDTYNANPASVAAALAALREIAGPGRAIAVLGDMLELGPAEEELHAEAGEEVARCGVDVLVAVGPRSRETARTARAAGVPIVRIAREAGEAARILREVLEPADTVLVKGSRGMGMERAVAELDHEEA